MYVAVSYDHRIIDGRESVSFLVRVKELLKILHSFCLVKTPSKLCLKLNKENADKAISMQHEKTSASPNNPHHFQSYLKAAASVIRSYHGPEPFHLFLKRYFSLYRKHGSRDRKMISSLCYGFFRVGFGVSSNIKLEEKILLGVFLCNQLDSPVVRIIHA